MNGIKSKDSFSLKILSLESNSDFTVVLSEIEDKYKKEFDTSEGLVGSEVEIFAVLRFVSNHQSDKVSRMNATVEEAISLDVSVKLDKDLTEFDDFYKVSQEVTEQVKRDVMKMSIRIEVGADEQHS